MFKWLRQWLTCNFVPLPDRHFIAGMLLMANFKRNDSRKMLQRYQRENKLSGFVLCGIFQTRLYRGRNNLFITVRVYRSDNVNYTQAHYYLKWSFGNSYIRDRYCGVIHESPVFPYSLEALNRVMDMIHSSLLTMTILSGLMHSKKSSTTAVCQKKLKKIHETFPPAS